MELSLDLFQTMAVAAVVFYLGVFLCAKVEFFRKYFIPTPVVGGVIFALVNLALHETGVADLQA